MYYKHFELSGPPFQFTPSTSVLYLGKGHRECLAALEWALLHENCGFMLLLGETGVGKTTLLCTILSRQLNDVRLACVTNPKLSFEEMMRVLLKQLGSTLSFGSRLELIDEFERIISDQRAGQRTAIIVDEAQDLSDETLEDMRLLANCGDSQLTGLQFVLMGQPELLDRLAAQNLRQIRERISAKATLVALSHAESIEYVECRLTAKGGKISRLFDHDALLKIVEASAGIPRRLNVLCHNALLVAYSEGMKKVDTRIAHEVIQDFASIYLNKAPAPIAAAPNASKPAAQAPAPIHSEPIVAPKPVAQVAAPVEPTVSAKPVAPTASPVPSEPAVAPKPIVQVAAPAQPAVAAKPIERAPVLLEDVITRNTIPLRPEMLRSAEVKHAEAIRTEANRVEVGSSETRDAALNRAAIPQRKRIGRVTRPGLVFAVLFILGVSVVLMSAQNAVGRNLMRSVGLLGVVTMNDTRPIAPDSAAIPTHRESATQPNAVATTGRIEEINSTANSVAAAPKIARPMIATVAAAPKADSRRGIQVGAGDTMHDLAERYLGSVDRTQELIALNPQIKNPDVLYPGETVYLPSEVKAEQE
jgi:type II secretory pathway predicted ATPase ExeA